MDGFILDKEGNEHNSNKKLLANLILVVVGAVLIFVVLELAKFYLLLPENLIESDRLEVKTVGVLTIFIIVLIALKSSSILDRLLPKIGNFKIALLSGLIVFIIEVLFNAAKISLIYENGFGLSYLSMLKTSLFLSVFGALVTNFWICRIRNVKSRIPVLLILGYWVLNGLLIKAFPSIFY